MMRFTRRTIIPGAFIVTLYMAIYNYAADLGTFEHYLNKDLALPTSETALSAAKAQQAAEDHFQAVRDGRYGTSRLPEDYHRDYLEVLDRWPKVSSAKPVLVQDAGGTTRIARYLVGLHREDKIGGFVAVDPETAEIMTPLLWSPKRDPLWIVDQSVWKTAESVNDLEALAELVPFGTQFTAGIPVDLADEAFSTVDGLVDVLPRKTQEERKTAVAQWNKTYGKEYGVEFEAYPGRRIATSKCLSFAASYIADWWSAQTGRTLPSYIDHTGGQLEYGFNPRLLEALYFDHVNFLGMAMKKTGNWKTAPFTSDRVTGEPVPYSTRGYARILAETDRQTVRDPTVRSYTYRVEDNPFGMDQRPLLFKIFRDTAVSRRTIKKDLRRSRLPWHDFSLCVDYDQPMTAERLKWGLDTYGPMLAQHMMRRTDNQIWRAGVHNCMLIGYGEYEGQMWFVYTETFGEASHRYLEDSYLGPSYRMMPMEYFYQAIAFPHHLYLELDFLSSKPDWFKAKLSVTSNRGQDPVDADVVQVIVDGTTIDRKYIRALGTGEYELDLPAKGASNIEVRATRKYFADAEGRNGFGVRARREYGKWRVQKSKPDAIPMTF